MASIGEELRRERVRRGLTFKDVEQVLHIRSAYLEAIEDGNFKLIPGHVYTKGFIRNYGNFLALDGTALVEMYKSSVEVRVPRPEVRTVATVKKSKVAAEAVHKKTRQGKWPEILIIAGIVIFFLLILWIMM